MATHQPYGFYKLPGWRLAVHNLACHTADNPMSRIAHSLLRKIALFSWNTPADIAIYDAQKVRPHPKDNICEKRKFLGAQLVVTIRPLVNMLKEHDIDSINAVKIDIEGYEEVALKAFF